MISKSWRRKSMRIAQLAFVRFEFTALPGEWRVGCLQVGCSWVEYGPEPLCEDLALAHLKRRHPARLLIGPY